MQESISRHTIAVRQPEGYTAMLAHAYGIRPRPPLVDAVKDNPPTAVETIDHIEAHLKTTPEQSNLRIARINRSKHGAYFI